MEIIAIDNGHGYNTPGKRIPDGSMREWEFNYAVAKYLKEELEYQGFKTYESAVILMLTESERGKLPRTGADRR